MRTASNQQRFAQDRYLLLVDTGEEDVTDILTVVCDGDPRTNRGSDFDAYRQAGAA